MLLDDIMNTPPVEPAGPEVPAAPAEPVVPEVPAAPVVPEVPAAPAEPAPAQPEEPNYYLPGQQGPMDEVDWLRRNYANSLNQIAALQQQVDAFQFEGLDDGERAAEELRRKQAQLEQQMQMFQQQQALQSWQQYYSQFTDDPDTLATQPDVVQMGHAVLTNLDRKLRQTLAELEALKVAAQPATQAAPPVTQGGGSPKTHLTLRDLIADPKAYERLMRKAQLGQLAGSDIPPLT